MNPDRSLLKHAGILLLLSLVVGAAAAIPGVANPRMVVSAHVAGLVTGAILLGLAAVWGHVRLSPSTLARVRPVLVVSLYLNLIGVALAGVFGTSASTPLGGEGFEGAAWQEAVVAVVIYASVLGEFYGFGAVAIGLARSTDD